MHEHGGGLCGASYWNGNGIVICIRFMSGLCTSLLQANLLNIEGCVLKCSAQIWAPGCVDSCAAHEAFLGDIFGCGLNLFSCVSNWLCCNRVE